LLSFLGKIHKDTIIVGFLLEYYSNHAMENIGWMFTVTQAIPLLLNCNLGLYLFNFFFFVNKCFFLHRVLVD